MAEAEARIEQRIRSNGPGVTSGGLLLNRVDVAVAITAGRPRDIGLIILQVFALAPTNERGHLVVDGVVELGIVLIAVIPNEKKSFIIIRAARTILRR